MERYLFGVKTYSLAEAVENFMALQDNVRRHHYTKYVIAAKWGWKQMLLQSIWSLRQQYLPVINGTVLLPRAASGFYSLSLEDECGNLVPLSHRGTVNTLQLECHDTKCSCSCGGSGTLCAAIDAISMRTEDVVIDGTTYVKRIWNKKLLNGNLVEITETPYFVPVDLREDPDDAVKYETVEKLICTFEVDNRGCIKDIVPNQELISKHCGCYLMGSGYTHCSVGDATTSRAGYFKADAENPNLIRLYDVKAQRVIVGYQTDGEGCDGEMMVPEYAMPCFFAALENYITAYHPQKSINEKNYASRVFQRENKLLQSSLNPIRVESFLALSGIIPKWGGGR